MSGTHQGPANPAHAKKPAPAPVRSIAEIEADIDIRPGVGIIMHEHRCGFVAAAAIEREREKIETHAVGGVRQGGKEPLFLVGA